MDVFVYCFTECLHSLVFFFVQSFLHLHTHSVFFFQTHTHSQVFAEMYSSLAENWFCNSLELGWREQGPRSAGGSSQSAFPSAGSHYSDRMTYKTACFCTTTSCVVYTPLNPTWARKSCLCFTDQPFFFSCPTAKWNSDFNFALLNIYNRHFDKVMYWECLKMKVFFLWFILYLKRKIAFVSVTHTSHL